MAEPDGERLLRNAARRVAADPYFLGSALAAYQMAHALDDAALAAWLGCTPARLSRLALCRRPDPAPATFRAGVEQIAAYAGVEPLRLATLLRDVDVAERFRGQHRPDTGLLAARDGEAEPPNSAQTSNGAEHPDARTCDPPPAHDGSSV